MTSPETHGRPRPFTIALTHGVTGRDPYAQGVRAGHEDALARLEPLIDFLERLASVRRDYPIDSMYDAGFLQAVERMAEFIKDVAEHERGAA